MFAANIWSLTLLAVLLLAVLALFRPFRAWLAEWGHSTVDGLWYKDPGRRYDRAIRQAEDAWATMNRIAAEAHGEIYRLRQEKIYLEGERIRLRQEIKYLKDSSLDDDAIDRAEILLTLEAELDFINGDPSKSIASAMDLAVETASQATTRLRDMEREIEALKREKQLVVNQYKATVSQVALYERLQKYGVDSDRSALDKLKERVANDTAYAHGLGEQYSRRGDVRSSRLGDVIRRQQAKDLVAAV